MSAIFPNYALGFRGWKLSKNGELKASFGTADAWVPHENQASCRHSPHSAPSPNCNCGLHAYHQLSKITTDAQLQRVLDRRGRQALNLFDVFGAVAGYGQIEIHDLGWRSEKARIIALWPALSDDERAKRIALAAERYQLPVVDKASQLLQLASAYAQPIPQSQLPDSHPVPEYYP